MNWAEIKQELSGPAVLVMAPFRQDLSLDLEALRRNVRYLADKGLTKGRGFVIVPCGTGEYVTLSKEEHRQMVEVAVQATDGELPVVAGVGTCNFKEAIELAENAQQAGAKCVMVPPPFYYTLSEDDFYEWYRLLAENLEVGIMVYDQNWRSELGTGIVLPVMERLTKLPSLISMKYGSPSQYMDMVVALDRYSERFAFIDNSLGFTSTVGHMHGAAGFISGPASWWPEFELRYWDLLEAGEYQEADKWHLKLAPYMRFFTGDEFGGEYHFFHAATVKASLEYVGLYGGPVRPPFRELTSDQKEQVFAVLDQIGAEKDAAVG
jgi:dihydrodipicolinate synthase/N-acetylneuraminate lyase